MMVDIAARYRELQQRVHAAEFRAGVAPGSATIVAVTKTWPVEVVLQAYAAGIRDFGENRPEELAEKRPALEAELGRDSGIVWHLIGPLQSRKTKLAAEHADVFHALDRLKIARRLSNHLEEAGRALPVFLEVNVSGEASKAGFDCYRWEDDEEQRRKIRQVVATVTALPRIELIGLMTMAPWDAPEEIVRRVFARTKALADWIAAAAPAPQLKQLSMGMTGDFELAVVEGATHVRVGRAIFGERTD